MANELSKAIGVISGTSMDGIDVALVETDGGLKVSAGAGGTYPYPPGLREELLAVIADPAAAESVPLTELETAVTAAHGDAIARFLTENAVPPGAIDVIGLHGQTIYHRPQKRFTRQLGCGAAIAARFGVRTVSRFRHADVAAGGEGAPLAPLYHQALAAELPHPLMVLNLGGVGNVTFIDGDTVIAFDTGPASAMIDDFVRRRRSIAFDAGGRIAAAGRPAAALVERFAAHPFFTRPAPKSLDRNEFHAAAADVEQLSDEDGAATLAEFTVLATIAALRQVPRAPLRWLVTGGGRHNAHIMRRLAAELRVPVEPVEAVGWDGDFLEAQCFGYLAVRTLLGLPLSLPTTTGVPHPLTGGEISLPP
ncbi:MAG TPA: anhydro-N-acetylmuramic acid kinase [Xanthobacteraceae bacterium]|nr:anhydro-N-acetylmuramic acid kinase [Xanthobacteraceae bacterium]